MAYRYLTHMTDKAMMERKTRYEVQEMLVAEHETDGSMEICYWRRFRTCIVDKIKERYVLEKNLMKRYKKHFTKFVQGRFFDELEVEGFLRERPEMQATELNNKNKSSLSTPSDVSKSWFLI